MFEAYAEASHDRINTGELGKTVLRVAIMCGSETVALRERQEEMMMLDLVRIRNEFITPAEDEAREVRLGMKYL